MCLRPLSFRTPSKMISLDGGQPFKITVKCGQCAECQKAAKNEWHFRAYYQFKDTINNGGYVYFDTLTYSDSNLPRLSNIFPNLKSSDSCSELINFPIFSREDIRLFFVRLRRHLTKLGYNPAHRLKYFLSSEYGTSENHTHRPHYHILFFVENSFIPWYTLSHAISDCWQLGRTDGLKFHEDNPLHVEAHVYSKVNTTSDVVDKVCFYVSKYVQKDSRYMKTVFKRLYGIYDYLTQMYIKPIGEYRPIYVLSDDLCSVSVEHDPVTGLPYMEKCKMTVIDRRLNASALNISLSSKSNFIKSLRRSAFQFHLQSKGFGESYLNTPQFLNDVKDGKMSITTSSFAYPVRNIPLPLYYQRKVFYNLVKAFDGSLKWELNDRGVDYKCIMASKTFNLVVDRFTDWYHNLPALVQDEHKSDKDNEIAIKNACDKAYALLDHRPISDFAAYVLFYMGRVMPSDCCKSVFALPSLDEWIPQLFKNGLPGSFFLPDTDSRVVHSDFSVGSVVVGEIDFYHDHIFNQNSFLQFRYFDELFNFYCCTSKSLSKHIQDTFDFIQDLKARHKSLKNQINPNYA